MNAAIALNVATDDSASVSSIGQFRFTGSPSAITFPGGNYWVSEALDLISGTQVSNLGNRFGGAVIMFEPEATPKALFNCHTGSTLPDISLGYPTMTSASFGDGTGNGGFSFDGLTVELSGRYANRLNSVFKGKKYIVDFTLSNGWFNSLGGASMNEYAHAAWSNYAHNTSLYTGYLSWGIFGPSILTEGFCAVYDLPLTVDSATDTTSSYNLWIGGSYNSNKYVIRCRRSVFACNVIGITDNSYGSYTESPSFLLHHDDTGDDAATVDLSAGGWNLEGNYMSCAPLTTAGDMTTRNTDIKQGFVYFKSSRVLSSHTTSNNICHVAGQAFITNSNDPRYSERWGAYYINGNMQVTSTNDQLILHGTQYATVDNARGYYIANMTNSASRVIIDGAKITGMEFTSGAYTTHPYAIYIDSTCTAGTIVIRDCTFGGTLSGCIYIHPSATCTVIVERPIVITTAYLAGSVSYFSALYPAGNPATAYVTHNDTSTPQFLAHLTATLTDVTGDGTAYAPITWTEITDKYANFAATTGIFTAPVPGRYLFGGAMTFAQVGAHSSILVYLVTSNRTYTAFGGQPMEAADATVVIPFNFYADMDAGDTAYIATTVSGSTKTVDIFQSGSSNLNTYFYGRLCN
jgi:hypothetical protein